MESVTRGQDPGPSGSRKSESASSLDELAAQDQDVGSFSVEPEDLAASPGCGCALHASDRFRREGDALTFNLPLMQIGHDGLF